MKKLLLFLFLLCFSLPVKAQSSCPDNNHPHMIDLGLPSGTLWACCNVGASSPEEYGGYYAWGETNTKSDYDEIYYEWSVSVKDGVVNYKYLGEIENTQYDVAHVKWGDPWRMPNAQILLELNEKCKMKWSILNGQNGIIVTGPNQKSIFLPACGARISNLDGYSGSAGLYPSSSQLSVSGEDILPFLVFNNTGWKLDFNQIKRHWGFTVRPVSPKQALSEKKENSNSSIYSQSKSFTQCPDNNHPHAIDLGLPSGTKWACCNVGASSPEEYGGYYAWGETEVQANNRYSWSSYRHCDGSSATCHNIGDDIAGTEYDVAHVKWGGSWRMPTRAQQEELIENCTREWTQLYGVNGFLVTGPNGGKVFLPAVGERWEGELDYEGSYGYYWSSSLCAFAENSAGYLNFNSGNLCWYIDYRSSGHTVRPVCP